MHTPPALFPLSGKFLVWLICIVRVFWRVIFWVDRSADVMYLDSQRMHCWWSHLNFRSVLLDICELPRKLLNKYTTVVKERTSFLGAARVLRLHSPIARSRSVLAIIWFLSGLFTTLTLSDMVKNCWPSVNGDIDVSSSKKEEEVIAIFIC